MSSFKRGPPQSVPLRFHFTRAILEKAQSASVTSYHTGPLRPVITDFHAAAIPWRYPGPPLPSANHIRLVLLQPGRGDSPIVCELVTADLESLPPYEALSYTWGDPLDRQAIYIKARKSQGRSTEEELEEFQATRNCVSALRCLRLEDAPRTLWIDALAIDQLNLEERNHQVSLMSQIYTRTAGVAIYLGESDADSELAMKTINVIEDLLWAPQILNFAQPNILVKALEAFFRRPWFTRVWVIQEAVLSERGTVYCGAQAIEWLAICRLEWHSRFSEVKLPSYPFVVSTSKERFVEGEFETSMLSALLETWHCEATDPRDKVYSLLPLLHLCKYRLGIAPRYGDPVAKVYTDCAAALVDRLGYEVLYAVQGHSRIPGLPSWVPDWSVPPRREILRPSGPIRRGEFWESQIQVQTSHKPIILYVPAPAGGGQDGVHRSLRVSCFSAGKILSLGSTYFAGRGHLPLKEWEGILTHTRFVDLAPLLFLMAGYPLSTCLVGGQSLRLFLEHEQKLDTAETAGRGSGDEEAGSKLSWERRVHRMTVERGRGDDSYVLPVVEIPFRQAGRSLSNDDRFLLQFLLKACHSRRYFLTDQGWTGLAPAEARKGDDVLVCVGADKPFVLRQCGGRERREDLPYGKRWEVWKGEKIGKNDMRQFRFVTSPTCNGLESKLADDEFNGTAWEEEEEEDGRTWEGGKEEKNVRQYRLVGEGLLDSWAWESIKRGRHQLEVIDIV